jgi:hypothetical protein
MKYKYLSLVALLFSVAAQAGDYTLECQTREKISSRISVNVNGLVLTNVDIKVDQELIQLDIPWDISYAVFRQNTDFLKKVDFEIDGNGFSAFFNLKVQGDHYEYTSYTATGPEHDIDNLSGKIDCIVRDSMGNPVKN